VFDALQKMSDEPLQDCPDCAQPDLRKKLSAPNFRLKGGGWYETDFKDKNKRNLADGGSSSDSKGSEGGKPADAKSSGTDSAKSAKSSPAKPSTDD